MNRQVPFEMESIIFFERSDGSAGQPQLRPILPYFSTKGRGTGLGLAIVNHILSDHRAQIRVEDNQPAGARFVVELPAIPAPDSEVNVTEVAARA